jgi:radical SAM protein with 4Fe4S-binding SPASM domain
MRIPLFERLDIESQATCNRTCWFCPRTYDRSGKYFESGGRPIVHRMPTEKILDLLDQAQRLGFQGWVAFHYYNEPLLDPRNLDLAHQARRRGMHPYLHTNGDRLKHSPDLCAAVAEVYERIVVGLYDFETSAQLAATRQEWHQRLPGTNLHFSPISPAAPRPPESQAAPRTLVPTDPRMALPDLTFGNAPCHRPLIRLVIQYDGTVANCCEDTRGDFDLGNAYSASLEQLWFSERHQRIVADLIAGHRERYTLCRNCPQPPTAAPAAGTRVKLALRRYRSDPTTSNRR